ncbi:MAG: AAA family ATPase, partial [Gammaproteobacteria bacterium]
YQAETGVAAYLSQLNVGAIPWGEIDPIKALPWVEGETKLQLSDSQKQAIATVLQHKVAIITGGPGVGKTTIVNSIIKIIHAKKLSIALCAPTGRAAKRLMETTGLPAKTIHRLLEFDPRKFAFKHDQDNHLPLDVLVIDEASMLDITLLHHLLKAIPVHAALLFVGDVDQLPSVGSGSVLADLITSKAVTCVHLTDIFRQAAGSEIVVNAHRINAGQMPLQDNAQGSDFYTLYVDEPEEIHDKLLHLVSQRIPQRFDFDPVTDIQVLTPMNRAGLGSRALNEALQQRLNPSQGPTVARFGWTFAVGDKVIQNINNYDKEVYNGDMGVITDINLQESELTISFGGQIVNYQFNELDEIGLAYAITIHKSQGSEFPVVVIPLASQHYMMLARNLLYTGVTRGKKLVILVAQKKAVAMAVDNNRQVIRLTKLAQRLNLRG